MNNRNEQRNGVGECHKMAYSLPLLPNILLGELDKKPKNQEHS
ncbi:hypothetical protein [Xenorhabdus mauleonii]|nr:hypothetical protein [Xenorhabdus mauleonii]